MSRCKEAATTKQYKTHGLDQYAGGASQVKHFPSSSRSLFAFTMSRAVASKDVDANEVAQASEIQRLLAEDKTPWYKKPNLRMLYLFLVPSALGVEMTSGYGE